MFLILPQFLQKLFMLTILSFMLQCLKDKYIEILCKLVITCGNLDGGLA